MPSQALQNTVKPSVLDAIGNTPLIRLKRACELTGCEILGKAEFLNPGQSVKDRAALAIIRDAERKGLLKPGGLIVEGTAGNTGIGLAMVASEARFRRIKGVSPMASMTLGRTVLGRDWFAMKRRTLRPRFELGKAARLASPGSAG